MDEKTLERARQIYWGQLINGEIVFPSDQRHPLVCVPAIAAALTAAVSEARAALETIQSLSAPGNRTIDDFIRDIRWINDMCRRALATQNKML